MRHEATIDRIRRELQRSLDSKCVDLDRVELLTAALDAFSGPVPNYEPRFHHLHSLMSNARELPATREQPHNSPSSSRR
jgi:hypothetical protein